MMAVITYPDSSHLIPGTPGFKQDLFNLAGVALLHGARTKEIANPGISELIPWVIEVPEWRLQTANGKVMAATAAALGCIIKHDPAPAETDPHV